MSTYQNSSVYHGDAYDECRLGLWDECISELTLIPLLSYHFSLHFS